MILKAQPITPDLPAYPKVRSLAKEAFPPEEYLDPTDLIAMAKAPDFDFLALYDEETFVGYFAVMTYRKMAYLFFLAIDPSLRSRGYGSGAIEALKRLYPGFRQVVDMEMPDETAPNASQRAKRRAFYLRNGYKPTGHFLSYFGVDYEILSMDEGFDFKAFQEMMSRLPVPGFDPVYFTR